MDSTPVSEGLAPKHAHIHFPAFKHDHPPVVNINEVTSEKLTLGQKVADMVAAGMGSWRFIIIQAIFLALWIIVNSLTWLIKPFDAQPFILLNLLLSFQAGFAAPFIMISQNRQSEKDRLTAQNDYLMDTKGEEEIRHIMEHLDHQDELILQLLTRLETQHQVMMGHLNTLDPVLAQKLEKEMQ
jgi:uncharacterized membrane protein